MGVVGIEEHHDALVAVCQRGHLPGDFGRHRRALDGVDLVAHRVGVDGRTIMRTDIDVDADHLAAARFGIERRAALDCVAIVQQRQHRGAHHQRAAVRDTGFDDQIGPAGPDQLLDGIEVLRHLDHRPAQPGEILRVGMPDRFPHPGVAEIEKAAVLADPTDILGHEPSEILDRIQSVVPLHQWVQQYSTVSISSGA